MKEIEKYEEIIFENIKLLMNMEMSFGMRENCKKL